MASLVVMLTAMSCGRISPGVISRPGPTVSAPSSGSNPGPSSRGYKSVYDEKGCVNGIGESGAALQAKCRSGK